MVFLLIKKLKFIFSKPIDQLGVVQPVLRDGFEDDFVSCTIARVDLQASVRATNITQQASGFTIYSEAICNQQWLS